MLAEDGDPYVSDWLLSFDTRERLSAYLQALQAVIDRHDILRTAVQSEGLREPVQVVWRRAPLSVQQVAVDAGANVAERLRQQYDPRHHRLAVSQAPLMRVCIAPDEKHGR